MYLAARGFCDDNVEIRNEITKNNVMYKEMLSLGQ